MKWKKRAAEIARLKGEFRGRRWRDSFPDLTVEQRTVPCSNTFTPVTYSSRLPADAVQFPVGHSHKQGLELLTPGMLKNDLQWMGGKKT